MQLNSSFAGAIEGSETDHAAILDKHKYKGGKRG